MLQECLVAPVTPGAATDVCIARVYVDQSAADATYGGISKAAHDHPERIWLVQAGGIGKNNDLATRFGHRGVLGGGFAQPLRLPVQDHSALVKRLDDLISAIA